MDVVWKFPLRAGSNVHQIPAHAEMLCVRYQDSAFGHSPALWVKVNTDNEILPREIQVVATGQGIDRSGVALYIGSIEAPDGTVWHAFDMGLAL